MNESYFKDLSRIQVMPKEQVAEEIRKHRTGDKNALNRIVEGNLRLVVHIANKYAKIIEGHDILTLDDLISEGNIGLVEAVEKYNPDTGVDFPYYASIWIKKQIIASLLNNLLTIKSPWNKLKTDGKIRKSIQKLEQEVSRDISENEIRELGIYKESEIQHYFNKASTDRIPEDFDIIQEEPDESDILILENLNLVLNKLKLREKEIITKYYGIDTEKQTLTEIGKSLGITKTRTWELKNRALNKIKLGLQP